MIKPHTFYLVTTLQGGLLYPLVGSLLPAGDFSLAHALVSGLFFIGIAYALHLLGWLTVGRFTEETGSRISLIDWGGNLLRFLVQTIFVVSFCLVSWQLVLWEKIDGDLLVRATLVYATTGLLVGLFYKARLLARQQKATAYKLALNATAHRAFQTRALTSELGPHFLFNAINVLTHLIREDPATAAQFAHRLAVVYAYFEQHCQQELLPLQKELELVDHYCFLLKTRFGERFRLDIQLPPQENHHYVLPCSLQLLIENSVKHNEMSSRQPLVITLRQRGGGWKSQILTDQ